MACIKTNAAQPSVVGIYPLDQTSCYRPLIPQSWEVSTYGCPRIYASLGWAGVIISRRRNWNGRDLSPACPMSPTMLPSRIDVSSTIGNVGCFQWKGRLRWLVNRGDARRSTGLSDVWSYFFSTLNIGVETFPRLYGLTTLQVWRVSLSPFPDIVDGDLQTYLYYVCYPSDSLGTKLLVSHSEYIHLHAAPHGTLVYVGFHDLVIGPLHFCLLEILICRVLDTLHVALSTYD